MLREVHESAGGGSGTLVWTAAAEQLLSRLTVARTPLQCKRRLLELQKQDYVAASGQVVWQLREVPPAVAPFLSYRLNSSMPL